MAGALWSRIRCAARRRTAPVETCLGRSDRSAGDAHKHVELSQNRNCLRIAGAILAAAMAFALPNKYLSEVVLHVSGHERDLDHFHRVAERALSRTALTQLMSSHNLYPAERQRVPMQTCWSARLQLQCASESAPDAAAGRTLGVRAPFR